MFPKRDNERSIGKDIVFIYGNVCVNLYLLAVDGDESTRDLIDGGQYHLKPVMCFGECLLQTLDVDLQFVKTCHRTGGGTGGGPVGLRLRVSAMQSREKDLNWPKI